MQKILIIDDDARLVKNVETYLKEFNYRIDSALNGADGLRKVQALQPDLVILDLMMPGLDGLEVCREIRKDNSVPIVMLTARGEESDVVSGLEVGADDDLTKPFSLRELAARVKVALRRVKAAEAPQPAARKSLAFGDLSIDPATRQVFRKKKPVSLTNTEFKLLMLFAAHPDVVFSRDRLLDEVRDRELDPFDRSIDAHISNLRNKIEDSPKKPRYIITVWGAGYKFQAS